MRRDRPPHVRRVGQERAQVPDRAQLHREPEPVVLPAPDVDQGAVTGVEVEEPGQLACIGVAGVAAVAAQLIRGQEVVCHAPGLPSWCCSELGRGRDSPVDQLELVADRTVVQLGVGRSRSLTGGARRRWSGAAGEVPAPRPRRPGLQACSGGQVATDLPLQWDSVTHVLADQRGFASGVSRAKTVTARPGAGTPWAGTPQRCRRSPARCASRRRTSPGPARSC